MNAEPRLPAHRTRPWALLLTLGALLVPAERAGAAGKTTPAAPPATTAPKGAPSAAEQAALTRGRALLKDFYAVKLDALWQAFTPQVRAQWATLTGFRAFRQMGVRQYGAERQLVQEQTFTRAGEVFYVRSATFEQAPELVWALVVGFRGAQVSTFGIGLQEDRSGAPVAGAPRAPATRVQDPL